MSDGLPPVAGFAPTCPRCADVLEPGAVVCPECKCRVGETWEQEQERLRDVERELVARWLRW